MLYVRVEYIKKAILYIYIYMFILNSVLALMENVYPILSGS